MRVFRGFSLFLWCQLIDEYNHGTRSKGASRPRKGTASHLPQFVRPYDPTFSRAVLAADSALIHHRSPEAHQAQLLHYIAVNGVENHLQRTPSNAVAVCRLLLEAGAAIDAVHLAEEIDQAV